jgi:hypothetical protein
VTYVTSEDNPAGALKQDETIEQAIGGASHTSHWGFCSHSTGPTYLRALISFDCISELIWWGICGTTGLMRLRPDLEVVEGMEQTGRCWRPLSQAERRQEVIKLLKRGGFQVPPPSYRLAHAQRRREHGTGINVYTGTGTGMHASVLRWRWRPADVRPRDWRGARGRRVLLPRRCQGANEPGKSRVESVGAFQESVGVCAAVARQRRIQVMTGCLSHWAAKPIAFARSRPAPVVRNTWFMSSECSASSPSPAAGRVGPGCRCGVSTRICKRCP